MSLEDKSPAELITELTTAQQQLTEYQTTIQVLQRRCQQLATQVTTQTAMVTALTGRLQAEVDERKRFATALMTSLKQIERAKQEWEMTVDSLPELVCLLDQDGRIIRANRTLERWHLGEVVTIHGTAIHQLLQSEWLQEWSRLKTILEEGHSIDTEVNDKKLDRQLYIRLQPILPYTNWHNQATASFAIVIIRDITKRKQFEELLQRRNQELSVLNRVGQVFISTQSLEQVLNTVLDEVRRMLGVMAYAIWLIEPANGELVCWQVAGPKSEILRNWRLPLNKGIAGWVAKHNQSVIVPDTRTDARHFKEVDQQIGLEIRSILSVPLRCKISNQDTEQEVIGVLHLVDTQINRFGDVDRQLLESLAATVAIMIENARLYDQLRQEAETKARLLQEVNHRVKNNLSEIIGLVYTEQRQLYKENKSIYLPIMKNLINRVQALATVHSLLSASEWQPLFLSELSEQIIHSTLRANVSDWAVSVKITPSLIRVNSDQAHNLALIINELTMNTLKQAQSQQESIEIRVSITSENDIISLNYRDNTVNIFEDPLTAPETFADIGFQIIQQIIQKNLQGTFSHYIEDGTVITIQFKSVMGEEQDNEDSQRFLANQKKGYDDDRK